MSHSIVNRPAALSVALPRTPVAQPHRAPVWTRLRAYLATVRRDPRDPQVIDLRDRGHDGRHDARVELMRAQARIFASR
jgi:hypothetical protein